MRILAVNVTTMRLRELRVRSLRLHMIARESRAPVAHH